MTINDKEVRETTHVPVSALTELSYGIQNGVSEPVLKTQVLEWRVPLLGWRALIHPLADEVAREVDSYFLEHWPFPNERLRKIFLNAGFLRVTLLYFPLSKDDCLHFACCLLTVLFLINDLLEHISFADGEAYNKRLIPIIWGDVLPNRLIPVEYIFYNLWESMRTCDRKLADEVLEPTFTFMRSQTDQVRTSIKSLGEYLEYRERNVSKALLLALIRFTLGLQLSKEELSRMRLLEQNCSKHISVVKDIYSWEKELQASKVLHKEGAVICSSVKVVANETNLSFHATKHVLWSMIREWEKVHDAMCDKLVATSSPAVSQDMRRYMKGLEHQMSGNEHWSRTTKKYTEPN